MEIVFERATAEDVPMLIEVQNQAFHDDYMLYRDCPSYMESEAAMADHVRNLIVYKILADQEIVGDVILRRRENSSYYLRVISVTPKYWNHGIGSLAIEFIEKQHPDAIEWDLITPHKDFRNHHFYEKMGYKKIREIPHSELLTLWQYQKVVSSK